VPGIGSLQPACNTNNVAKERRLPFDPHSDSSNNNDNKDDSNNPGVIGWSSGGKTLPGFQHTPLLLHKELYKTKNAAAPKTAPARASA